MQPYDPTGVYAPSEVLAALQGANGVRDLSFRFERLDTSNTVLGEMTTVVSASVANNNLADIKRTAKFVISDDEPVNYLSDRIRPYCRIAMPSPIGETVVTDREDDLTLGTVGGWEMTAPFDPGATDDGIDPSVTGLNFWQYPATTLSIIDTFTGLVPGRQYTFSCTARAWLSTTGDVFNLSVVGIGSAAPSLIDATFRTYVYTFTATAPSHDLVMTGTSTTDVDVDIVVSMARLAHIEIGPTDTRRGYVEWPLGVFLLTSPKRSMRPGDQITRDVEAYDQLLVLTDNVVSDRYEVAAGVRYTDAVTTVAAVPIRTNLVLNPSFEVNTTGWSPDTSYSVNTLTRDTAQFYTGTASMRINEVTPIDNTARTPIGTAGMPVIGGLRYTAQVRWKATAGRAMTFGLTFYTAAGAAIVTKEAFLTATGGWDLGSVSRDAPATAAFASIQFTRYGGNVTNGAFTYIDSVLLEQASSVGTFFDGSTQASTTVQYLWTGSAHGSASISTLPMNITPSTKTLPVAMSWEPGTSYLRIINDLLSAVNYESAWFDENGTFVARPYQSPETRPPEYTYATDETSVISGTVDQVLDLYGVANKWVLVVSDPDRAAIVGSYTNTSPSSPTSTVNRGRTIVDFRTEQDAADSASLNAKAQRLAFEASQVYEEVEFSTAVMPIHSNSDVYTITVDEMGVGAKYSEHTWEMPLVAGGLMKHSARRIVNLGA